MESNHIRKVGLIPVEDRTPEDNELYSIYTKARDNTTGSMTMMQYALGMESVEFYHKLDYDPMFREAVLQGLSDGRSQRLLELESSLIRLALGTSTDSVSRNTVTNTDANGATTTTENETIVHREYPPNLTALQVLLEKYQGASWTVTQRVVLEDQTISKEVPYSMLTKKQLKQLAEGGEKK